MTHAYDELAIIAGRGSSAANGRRCHLRRVSTKEQTENLSLPTQLKACEEYCERQGFNVLARFREEGESAKTAIRTEVQKLLQYCRLNKGRVQFVVVFNLTRFRERSTTISRFERT